MDAAALHEIRQMIGDVCFTMVVCVFFWSLFRAMRD